MLRKIRKYLPIKVHNTCFGYGWWYGDKIIFFEKHWIPFCIIPSYIRPKENAYANNGMFISSNGRTHSWDCYDEQFYLKRKNE